MHRTMRAKVLLLIPFSFAAHVAGEEDAASIFDKDRAAIERAIQSYVAASNAQNSKAMADQWSPEGVYISNISGERVVGREAIADSLAKLIASEGKRQLAVATESIEFVSPNVALERGTATVEYSDQSTSKTAYRAIYVRRDGTWLIDRITEDETRADSHGQRLKELEWMIGDWVDRAGDDMISIECKWAKNRNYLSRAYTVDIEDRVASSGLQIIGWDPKQNRIRSWLFDSEGGFVEGTWSKKGDRWFVQSVATLADGSTGSFTSIFDPLDADSYRWKKVHRVVNGQVLPNVNEVVITRQ